MAYAFSRTFGLLDGQQPQKQDIFGGQQQGQEQQQSQGLSLTGGGESIGSGASSSTAPTGSSGKIKDTNVNTPSSAGNLMQLYSSNQGQKADFLGNVKSGVESAQKKLDEEVAAYSQAPQAQTVDYGAMAKNLIAPKTRNPITGARATEAENAIRQGLANQPAQVEQFQSGVDTSFGDVEKLKSQSGLADLYKQQVGGGEYTGKLARFDAAKLAGEKSFQEQQKQLAEAAGKVRSRQEALAGPGESDIELKKRQAVEAQSAQKRQAIIDALKGAQSQLLGGAESRMQLASTAKAPSKETAARQQQLMDQFIKEHPELKSAAGKVNLDLGAYYNAPTAGLKEYATADEAARYNKISELLGLGGIQGDTLTAGGAPTGSYAEEQYLADLLKQATAERAKTKEQPGNAFEFGGQGSLPQMIDEIPKTTTKKKKNFGKIASSLIV